MIKNYLLIAIRSFLRHKSFTLLNVFGLTLGMVASLLILQYVKYERSFDAFHSQAEDIYRIQYNQWQDGKLRFECAAAVPAVGPALKNNFPEVKTFARLFPVSGVASYESPEHGVVAFREEKMQIADATVFDVFNIPLIEGDKENALKGPDKTVISEWAAKKYFAAENPIGKTISWDGHRKFEVTGIFKNLPANSHIKFDFLFSYETLNRETQNSSETSWGWYDFNTYVVLNRGTDSKALQTKWDEWLQKERGEDWKKYNAKQEFILQPLLDIHLGTRLLQESQPDEQGDRDSVYALSVIAFFILIIAWVNYINLATARSFDRANEVGVRKVMGAMRDQLIRQFLMEAFLVNLLAAVISLLAVRMVWPFFSLLSGRNIPIEYFYQSDFWTLLGALFLIGILFSGFYPALVLSSFKPVSVLKGKLLRSRHGDILRKALVVFQFAASVVLIIGSAIVYQQLKFMRGQELGIDIHQTLVVKGPGVFVDSTFEQSIVGLKEAVHRIPGIKNMTASSNVPGDEIFWSNNIRRMNRDVNTGIIGYTVGIDHDYIPAFQLNVIEGRNFDLDHPRERSKSVILNEAMVEALDISDAKSAIGEKVIHGRDTLEVVGVLEDYHQMSLKESIVPLVYRYRPQFASFFSFKVESDNYAEIVEKVKGAWQEYFPGNPLDYFFLDQFFNRQYDQDDRFRKIFTLFTLLAIFVACLGLFGLASFMTMQRTKEIGIRKVLGSSVSQVVLLLSKGFIQLVIVANIIAWPLAWYLMNNWLESFPYRIGINLTLFALAGLGVLVIAFISVSFQTMKAARVNPATSLKSE